MSMASSFCQCIGPIGHDTAFAWGVGSSQIEIIGESVIIRYMLVERMCYYGFRFTYNRHGRCKA